MNCLFVATGRARDDARQYRCGHCRFECYSRYEGEQIHRECPAGQPSPALVTVECVYRGLEVIEVKECDLCGERGQPREVFACRHPEHTGPCVQSWWTNRIGPRAGYTSCLTCRDRELPDGTRPWEEVAQMPTVE